MANKRNQPCPCGSGKRYKKCCGRVGQETTEGQVSQETITGLQSAAECVRLGEIAVGQRNFEQAANYFRQAIRLKPDSPDTLNNLGVICQSQGKLEEAANCFRRLVDLDPNSAIGLCNHGVVQKAQGFHKEAESSFRRALAANPGFAEAHYNLGVVLEDQGFWDRAEKSYQQALAHKPGYVNALNRLGNLKKNRGDLEEAAACYLRALKAAPESDMTHFNLARILEEQGRLAEALDSYRQALAIRPDYGETHRCISSLVKYETRTDEHLQIMEQLFSKNNLPDSERMHLAFALGKAYEDLAEYEKSFAFYQKGNQLKRATFSYSTSESTALFDQIKQVWSRGSFPQDVVDDAEMPKPVFILGMPRSGTTLVEQILASHPEVYGAGELMDLEEAILQVTGTTELPGALNRLGNDQGSMYLQIGEEYLRRLREYGPVSQFVTDKMPTNFMYIGIIRRALPDARIIHCRRDPLDTCFSIYKNFFAGEIQYAYNLTELGEFYRLYESLMQFWQQQISGGVIYDLSYERLVSEQEQETRRLLDFCGLPWYQDCLTFHKTQRRVETASSTQVRRPIYRDSVARWQKYEQQLAPLKAALESASC